MPAGAGRLDVEVGGGVIGIIAISGGRESVGSGREGLSMRFGGVEGEAERLRGGEISMGGAFCVGTREGWSWFDSSLFGLRDGAMSDGCVAGSLAWCSCCSCWEKGKMEKRVELRLWRFRPAGLCCVLLASPG